MNLDTVSQSAGTLNIIVKAKIVRGAGGSVIGLVNCNLTDASESQTLANANLLDNGIAPDAVRGDSLFTGVMAVPAQPLSVGNYYCQIYAQSQGGFSSNTYLLPLGVVRQTNRPPVLSNLQAPDTVSLGNQNSVSFSLLVKATDPDGQLDIAKVFFYSYKPDGSEASGNPFLMYDDGSEIILFPPDGGSGDLVKGDSIYTLTVTVSASNAKGAYRFEFQAMDRSNAVSQKLIKYIQVAP